MSTSGTFNYTPPTNAFVDAESHLAVIPAASNALQTINPASNYSSFTAYNYSAQWIRGLLAFTGNAPAATGNRYFVIPPGGTYSANYENDAATTGYIDSIALQAVTAPAATAAASALVFPANFTGSPDAIVAINFIVE